MSDAARLGRAQTPVAGGAYTSKLGRPRVHLRCTPSTNDFARELALAGAPGGTLVTATEQSAGRGRQGRRWTAPAGSSLLMSLLLRSPPALLPLIAAVAVCDVAGKDALIKWPNDIVLLRGSGLLKLAGILAEGRPQEGWAVLGIGLNVSVELAQLPAELQRSAASLERPREEIEPTLARLLEALARRLREPPQQVLEAWRARDALAGRAVAWSGGRGVADGIDGAGRLIVRRSDGGRSALEAGEVHLETTP
ncbi:MAG: biotin--[acetyl-CoA-carboxylase] ligase [Actinobacteria bacterium]|nr:MAG: biotin--[acetyl-CoA-carboxylase] ligase [Actinomycetota bacterium]